MMISHADFYRLVLTILKSGTGFGVEFAEVIHVSELEDGTFRVFYQPDPRGDITDRQEWIYLTAEQAAKHVTQLRSECKIGFDYERGGNVNE